MEGEDLQLGGQVDLAHDHAVGDGEHGGGEVEHRAHPGSDEVVAGLLGTLGLAVLALPTIIIALDVTVLHLAAPVLARDLDPYGFLLDDSAAATHRYDDGPMAAPT